LASIAGIGLIYTVIVKVKSWFAIIIN
jgi:hypothetical protein